MPTFLILGGGVAPREEAMMSDNLDRLKLIGFTLAGSWKLPESGLHFELTEHSMARNILYAFVADGLLMYIGKTIQPLRARMGGYKFPVSGVDAIHEHQK